MWLYYWEPLKVIQHPTKYGHHSHFGSGDLIVLVCHLILEDHVIKDSCDFISRGQSSLVTILLCSVNTGTMVLGIHAIFISNAFFLFSLSVA